MRWNERMDPEKCEGSDLQDFEHHVHDVHVGCWRGTVLDNEFGTGVHDRQQPHGLKQQEYDG